MSNSSNNTTINTATSSGGRSHPYLSKSPENWATTTTTELENAGLLLVNRSGPIMMTVQDQQLHCYKVTLGNPHSCTCSTTTSSMLCIHKIYCIIKVLKVPVDHPLAWQLCYSDNELNQVLNGIVNPRQPRPRKPYVSRQEQQRLAEAEAAAKENTEGYVARQILSEEDGDNCCPVCQDDMRKDQALSWCRMGCGNNIHAQCMQRYAAYHTAHHGSTTATGQTVPCPLCRTPWSLDHLRDDCRGKSSLKKSSAAIQCILCSMSGRGIFYRCVECSCGFATSKSSRSTATVVANNASREEIVESIDNRSEASKWKPVDMCESCFSHNNGCKIPPAHHRHHFVSSEATVGPPEETTWTPAVNPKAPKKTLPLHVLESLQGRELTAADYELMLSLDRNGPPDLPTHLTESLPRHSAVLDSSSTSATASTTNPLLPAACWCGQAVLVSTPQVETVRLPCSHLAHSDCVKAILSSIIIDDGTWKISEAALCLQTNCSCAMFKGLSRKRRKRAPTQATSGAAAASGETTNTQVGEQAAALPSSSRSRSPLFGISGTSVLGSGAGASAGSMNANGGSRSAVSSAFGSTIGSSSARSNSSQNLLNLAPDGILSQGIGGSSLRSQGTAASAADVQVNRKTSSGRTIGRISPLTSALNRRLSGSSHLGAEDGGGQDLNIIATPLSLNSGSSGSNRDNGRRDGGRSTLVLNARQDTDSNRIPLTDGIAELASLSVSAHSLQSSNESPPPPQLTGLPKISQKGNIHRGTAGQPNQRPPRGPLLLSDLVVSNSLQASDDVIPVIPDDYNPEQLAGRRTLRSLSAESSDMSTLASTGRRLQRTFVKSSDSVRNGMGSGNGSVIRLGREEENAMENASSEGNFGAVGLTIGRRGSKQNLDDSLTLTLRRQGKPNGKLQRGSTHRRQTTAIATDQEV